MPEIIKTYDYTDESGTLLYQNVRFEPKDFRQRHSDGNGDWIWNLDGVRRVLYRLPELVEISKQDFVCVTEGEGKCDRLRELGFSVTTSGSATSWRPEFAQQFKGSLVCVLPDNDTPGRRYAKTVADSLQGVAAIVKIIELPGLQESEDIKDWLDAGNTAGQLLDLIEKTEPYAETAEPAQTGAFHLTDAGNAERFAATQNDKLRYCPEHARWYFWDGCRWNAELGEEKAGQLAIVTARSIVNDAKDVVDSKERERILLWSMASENASRLRAMLSLAQDQDGIVCHARDFNKDAYLLNCLNGTLDLRRGTLLKHDPDDMITTMSPVTFDEDATLQLWDDFLNDATGSNAPLKDFLQTTVGYSLTGDVREENFFFVHGPTCAGKTTWAKAISNALGDYAATADFETFLKRTQGGARNDIARLADARFVVSVEIDEGAELAEGLVKVLTGGDTIACRFLYQESFEFVPHFKLWLVANHAPRASDRDDALWRRILRIPFEHSVPENERRPEVKRILCDPKVAGPAILAWAVRGCLLWQKYGLSVPEIVRDSTRAYREELDPLRDFFEDECVFDLTAFVPVADLRKRYEDWGKETGLRYPLGPRQFNERLSEKGCRKVSRRFTNETGTEKVGKCWSGVRIATRETYAAGDEKTGEIWQE